MISISALNAKTASPVLADWQFDSVCTVKPDHTGSFDGVRNLVTLVGIHGIGQMTTIKIQMSVLISIVINKIENALHMRIVDDDGFSHGPVKYRLRSVRLRNRAFG